MIRGLQEGFHGASLLALRWRSFYSGWCQARRPGLVAASATRSACEPPPLLPAILPTEGRSYVRVTGVEVIWPSSIAPAPFFFVQVHTDEGIVGLGQAPDPRRTMPVVLEWAEKFLIGRDPLERERFWRDAFEHAAFHGYAGAEMRAISALDIALWDIAGQVAGLPLYQLLGGKLRDRLPIYNTCSNYGDRSDRKMVREEPLKLVEELLANGISTLKYSPLDALADQTRGQYLDERALAETLAPIREIYRAYGTQVQVGIEGHGKWGLTAASTIARHFEEGEYNILWLEDLMRPEHPEQLGRLRSRTKLLLGGSELLFTRWQFLPLLQAGGTDVVIADISWCGGVSELMRLGSLADTFKLPIAPHDHTGPVAFIATAHVMAATPNIHLMETTRVFYEGYYPELVDPAPVVRNGAVELPEGPGLGTRLRPKVFERPDIRVERVEATSSTTFYR